MSSSYSANQQQTSVAHVILDSLTRCFHPTDGGTSLFSCPPRISRTTVVDFPGPSNKPKTQPPSQQPPSQQQPPPPPPPPPHQYDADRYIHRKLEIFRTTEEECLAEFGVAPRKKGQSSSHTRNNRRGHNRSGSGGATLVASSDDEIKNLTENQKRTSAQAGGTRTNNAQACDESLAATFGRLLRDPLGCITNVQGQYNDGLCVATPVRAASRVNVANMSDWKLTAEEFAARYGVDRGGRCGRFGAPDVDESSASLSHLEEEETITSASYFDHKYSHLIETSPPMPLFDDHRVAVSERETDAIFKIAKNKREAHEVNSNRSKTDPQKGGGGGRSRNTTPRSSPADHIVAVITKTPRRMTLSKKSKKGSSPAKGGNTKKGCDLAPMGKSSSVSDTSHDGEQHHHRHNQQPQRNFCEPDIVHYTLGK